ncbi:MAG TPA: response regulator [Burkholderiaceae bacterium]|nr:response regulator [Burkholderiaceae bacterium]
MNPNPKGTILVVDDDRLVLATLTHGLSQAGYRVVDADNGDDAILLAREHQPALALLDIRMQGKSGFDVAEYLREYHQIPFVFLSAFSDEATLARARSLGAAAQLTKPLDIAQILPVVDAVLTRSGEPDEGAGEGTGEGAGDVAHAGPQPPMVWMAVGALMHRHSIDRNAALRQLRRIAHAEKRPLLEQAERVLQAVEALGLPDPRPDER